MARSMTTRKGRWLRRHGIYRSGLERTEGLAPAVLGVGEDLYNGAQAERR